VSVRRHDRYARLLNADTGFRKDINETGLFVWQNLNGDVSIGDIAIRLAEACGADGCETVFDDVRDFVVELRGDNLVDGLDSAVPGTAADEPPNIGDAPNNLDLSLTGKCNQSCEYCFYADEMVGRSDLPTEEWLVFFGELKRLAVENVTLSGGEIFMRQDLWTLIDGIIDARLRFSILSNGTLITEQTIEKLLAPHRRRRLLSIQVSIDGSCAEVHDASRGKGTFDRALRGLRLLKAAGVPVTCRVTVNRFNVDDLENTAAMLLEEEGLASFGTNSAMPIGEGCTNRGNIALTPTQRWQAMQTLVELEKRYPNRVKATAGPLANAHMYSEMEHARATGKGTHPARMGHLTSCGCVFNKIAVHHDGVIVPCNMLSIEMGRINRDSIKTIWRTHPVLKDLKARRSIPMEQVAGCEDCEWTSYCCGGCPGLAYDLTGNFNRGNPEFCYRAFLAQTGVETVRLVPCGEGKQA